MSHSHGWSALAFGAVLLASCAAPAASPSRTAGEAPTQPSRTLVVAIRAEPPSLVAKAFRTSGLSGGLESRMFNAGLLINNDTGTPVPYLAEAVPQLNTDSWRVFPDGTMETVYRLKANAIWHDGLPLTAEDFVFSHQVYSTPELGQTSAAPISLMDQVTAPDPRSVVIRWKNTYPEAGSLQASNFPPLPRHILGPLFQPQNAEAFVANPFWSQQYIGAGPYRLDRWEPGAFLEGVAVDGDVLGKPRIPRIRELFIGDENTVVANVLSGAAHLTGGDSIRFEQGRVLRQQWADGSLVVYPGLLKLMNLQLRPEYANTRAFTDLRVRQALAYGIDRDAHNQALFGGEGIISYTAIQPTVSYYADVDRAVTKYPFEPRKTEQLMADAGFTKGSDGVWTSPTYGRMAFEATVAASVQNNNENAIMANTWRRLGFDVTETQYSTIQSGDREARNTFPGLWTGGSGAGDSRLAAYRSDRIATPANRWTGSNYGGAYFGPDFDRFVDVFETSLDRSQRNQAAVQMARIISETCLIINMYFQPTVEAVATGLTGPRVTDPNGSSAWNLNEWEFR